ncbi:STAS domain-containing protein [Actinomadura sp. LCR2-06]|uniref:STAS domain-containing protein n=1 Tax=Actinomadura violacea TaxID=2819934 RepID=A0ABS3RN56_9ACTN|nr:STAS domain-containing protein [Actinomadura violacea]
MADSRAGWIPGRGHRPCPDRRGHRPQPSTRPPRIALELSGFDVCDSSGINAFVQLLKRINAAGGQPALLRPLPRLAKILSTTRADLPPCR